MSQRIKLPKRDPGVRVDLGPEGAEVEFALKPITLEIEEELKQIERENAEVQMNPDSSALDLAEAELRQLDVILEPTGKQQNSKAWSQVPSELLLGCAGEGEKEERQPGYLTGDVTRSQIQSTVARIIQAARPT